MTRRRVALVLWLVFALVVWNVVFDRVLVLAGRRFVFAAATSAAAGGPYLRAGDWMMTATHHGIRLASSAAIVILAIGAAGIGYASRQTNRRSEILKS